MKIRKPNMGLERARIACVKQYHEARSSIYELSLALIWDTLGCESFTLRVTWTAWDDEVCAWNNMGGFWQYDLCAVDGEATDQEQIWAQMYGDETPILREEIDLFDIMNFVVETSYTSIPGPGDITFYREDDAEPTFAPSMESIVSGLTEIVSDLSAA